MDPHYVHAEKPLGDEDSRVLKQGDTFAIFDHYGNIKREGLGEEGLYHDGTRFLSFYCVLLGGVRPLILNSTIEQGNAVLTVDMTNPDLRLNEALLLPKGILHIFRSIFLWNGTLYERVRFKNYSHFTFETSWIATFGCDYADIFEVRGTRRARRGHAMPPIQESGQLVLSYTGLDGIIRRTLIASDDSHSLVAPSKLEFPLYFRPGDEKHLVLSTSCEIQGLEETRLPFEQASKLATRAILERKNQMASVVSSDTQLNAWINRSQADLHMMVGETRFGAYPYAGVPWFSTPFGRDGIITALECLWLAPEMAKGVLSFLAATQADSDQPARDAQPGKILHETRGGEMAALSEIPFGKYYGSVDSTPLFVFLAGRYLTATGDVAFLQKIWPHVLFALEWIDRYGDRDGDGFVEYYRESASGLTHQGWKDSEAAVFHADGTAARGPIALCEVQAYVYAAKREGAKLAQVMGDDALAVRLEAAADELQEKFERAFWCDSIQGYALALDGAKRQCEVRSSNAGQVLFSGIASQEHADRMAANLFSEDLFSGWGIRTISSSEIRYNPMSYHNGSIWPHDNALVAWGLSQYGKKKETQRLFEVFFEASTFVNLNRMPELFCGFNRRNGEGPTPYPVACSPQAWSAASVFLFLGAALGLNIEAYPKKRIQLTHAMLPEFVNEVRISRLRVGDSQVDLLLRRHQDDLGITVLKRQGDLEIIVVK